MPWNYAREIIEKALNAAGGNATTASRAIMNAASTDARLMNELAAPHLKGIVAHAVAHVIRAQNTPPETHPDDPQALDMPLDTFGRELLGALSGRDTPRFGQEAYGAASTSHKPASKAHIEAMKKIARRED